MKEKCRFSECNIHLCHGKECKGCCKTTKCEDSTKTVGVALQKEKHEQLFLSLKETIKNCSDDEVFRAFRLLRAELERRKKSEKPFTIRKKKLPKNRKQEL